MKIKPGTPFHKIARMSDVRKWEDLFLFQVKSFNLPIPIQEYSFAKQIGRKWRFDFAWPNLMLAVECEGAIYSYGRHNRGSGYKADLHKYNAAALMGWLVLRYCSDDLKSGDAITEVKNAIHSKTN